MYDCFQALEVNTNLIQTCMTRMDGLEASLLKSEAHNLALKNETDSMYEMMVAMQTDFDKKLTELTLNMTQTQPEDQVTLLLIGTLPSDLQTLQY